MTNPTSSNTPPWDADVLIIGGGAAGLAAALTLGRLRRKVLVCDDGHPRNQPALHMHNFPGFDGVSPAVWREKVQKELLHYPSVSRVRERVLGIQPLEAIEGFTVHSDSGRSYRVRKVLLVYGVKDPLPAIPGLQALWGHTVVHCPYCHGFEFKDQRIGILGQGEMLMHMLPLLRGLSTDIKVFSPRGSGLNAAQRQLLQAQNIELIERPIQKLVYTDTQLQGLVLDQGETIACDALYITPQLPVTHQSNLGLTLGCETDEMGFLIVNEAGETRIPGIFAAGDVAGRRGQSVLNSAASGSMTAAQICHQLLAADFNAGAGV